MSFWVVSYDIPNDKRRRQVSKVLEGYGRRVQYSVFECDLDEVKITRLELALMKEIDEQEDDIRFYPLNKADLERVKMLGLAELRQKQDYYIV
jgi:CRISPR-associated protein Cas2